MFSHVASWGWSPFIHGTQRWAPSTGWINKTSVSFDYINQAKTQSLPSFIVNIPLCQQWLARKDPILSRFYLNLLCSRQRRTRHALIRDEAWFDPWTRPPGEIRFRGGLTGTSTRFSSWLHCLNTRPLQTSILLGNELGCSQARFGVTPRLCQQYLTLKGISQWYICMT